MTVAEMLKKNRESAGMSPENLAKSLSVPVEIITYLEDPATAEASLIKLLAKGLGVTPQVFTGEEPLKPPEPTEDEKTTEVVKDAKFPHIRRFILDPERCENPEKAIELFGSQPLSLTEKNVILYLSTTALYHFCDTNTSSFSFDEYLFKLHAPLVAKCEKELQALNLPAEEMEERLGVARGNIFSCDSMSNISIRVVEQFAVEMEEKLSTGLMDFEEDLDLPFNWSINDTLMKIEIKDPKGNVKDQIKLLDVKERK